MNYELSNIVAVSDSLYQIRKSDLRSGDELQLVTVNSHYNIRIDDDGEYVVSGGWFDRMEMAPAKIKINGCTWGGSIIKTDIIAACGLFVEFSNKLLTSKIQKIYFFPKCSKN